MLGDADNCSLAEKAAAASPAQVDTCRGALTMIGETLRPKIQYFDSHEGLDDDAVSFHVRGTRPDAADGGGSHAARHGYGQPSVIILFFSH